METLAAEALEVLRKGGWIKDNSVNSAGAHCLGGAMDVVLNNWLGSVNSAELHDLPSLYEKSQQVVAGVIAEQYPRYSRNQRGIVGGISTGATIIQFNDAKDVKFEDVERVLEKADAKLQEEAL